MNKLIVIGWLGIKTCYLNISREEAIKRYLKEENNNREDDEPYNEAQLNIDEFEFVDSFGAYDAWKQ